MRFTNGFYFRLLVAVDKIITHPGYNSNYDNDIALLRLATKVLPIFLVIN